MPVGLKGIEMIQNERTFGPPKFFKQEAGYENHIAANTHYNLWKRKGHSEWEVRGPEGRATNHGENPLGWSRNEFGAKHLQYLPDWISKLLWATDTHMLSFPPLCTGYIWQVFSAFPTIVSEYVGGREPISLVHRPANRLRGTVLKELRHTQTWFRWWDSVFQDDAVMEQDFLGPCERVNVFCMRERHAFWCSYWYLAAFHTALGLVWMTNTVQQKWRCVTSEIRL